MEIKLYERFHRTLFAAASSSEYNLTNKIAYAIRCVRLSRRRAICCHCLPLAWRCIISSALRSKMLFQRDATIALRFLPIGFERFAEPFVDGRRASLVFTAINNVMQQHISPARFQQVACSPSAYSRRGTFYIFGQRHRVFYRAMD